MEETLRVTKAQFGAKCEEVVEAISELIYQGPRCLFPNDAFLVSEVQGIVLCAAVNALLLHSTPDKRAEIRTLLQITHSLEKLLTAELEKEIIDA